MAWPESIEALIHGGIKSVNLANNHMGDFGSDAVKLTNTLLHENHIEVLGLTNGLEPPYSNQVCDMHFSTRIQPY